MNLFESAIADDAKDIAIAQRNYWGPVWHLTDIYHYKISGSERFYESAEAAVEHGESLGLRVYVIPWGHEAGEIPSPETEVK